MGKSKNGPFALGLVVLLSLLLFVAKPSFGQSRNVIVVTDADTIREEGSTGSTDLTVKVDGVADRVVLRQANTLIETLLATLPTALNDKLNNVADRVVTRRLNTLQEVILTAIPVDLETKLNNVAARVVTRRLNTLQQVALSAVPNELQAQLDVLKPRFVLRQVNTNQLTSLQRTTLADIGGPAHEDIPPVIENVGSAQNGGSNVSIQWTTDEFATSKVEYGTQPGSYTAMAESSEYLLSHELAIAPQSRSQATTYYYRVSSTDLSGNTTTSAESSFDFTVPTAVQLRSFVTSSLWSPLLLALFALFLTGLVRRYSRASY